MTVPMSFDAVSFDDSDLAKSLGLLDGCDAFPWSGTQDFLGDDMLSFDGDLLSMPSLPVPQMDAVVAPLCVSPMVPAQNWPPEPLNEQHRIQSLSPASSGEFYTHITRPARARLPWCIRTCRAVPCVDF